MNISSDVIISVCSTMLGTVLGWLLNSLSNSIGKIKICTCEADAEIKKRPVYKTGSIENNVVHQQYIGQEPESIIVDFSLLVTNKKAISCGINGCRVYIKGKNKKEYIFNEIFKNENSINEFDTLLNIEGKMTKKVRFRQENILWTEKDIDKYGYEIWLEYRINGKTRLKKYIIKKVESSHQN